MHFYTKPQHAVIILQIKESTFKDRLDKHFLICLMNRNGLEKNEILKDFSELSSVLSLCRLLFVCQNKANDGRRGCCNLIISYILIKGCEEADLLLCQVFFGGMSWTSDPHEPRHDAVSEEAGDDVNSPHCKKYLFTLPCSLNWVLSPCLSQKGVDNPVRVKQCSLTFSLSK